MFTTKIIKVTLAVLILLVSPITQALLADDVESLIQQHIPNVKVGIVLMDPSTGKVLYEKNAKQLFTPASTTKLFTATAGLLTLGSDYRFETLVKANLQNLKAGRLDGDLALVFNGDPSLTVADVKALIAKISAQGITEIKGDVIIDDSRFQSPDYAMGWSSESLAWYYAAPITTTMLNQNQLGISIVSNPKLGQKATVSWLEPEIMPSLLPLQSNILSVSEEDANTICQIEVQMNDNNALNIKGCWPLEPNPRHLKVAVKNPYAAMKQLLIETFKNNHIRLIGKIKRGVSSEKSPTMTTHYSKSLNDLLKNILQDSNNVYAEALLKTLGVTQFQRGTFQSGARAVQAILEPVTGINASEWQLLDGSGLSNYNLVTPMHLAHLLATVQNHPTIATIFKEALPVSGVDGTLKNRANQLQGNLRAKTGTMAGTSSLAGFLTTKNNKELVLVVMCDHFLQPRATVKAFEDKLSELWMELE